MEYHVEFTPEAEIDLARLDRAVAQRILTRVRWLAQHIEEISLEPVTGKPWKGLFKFRVGDYRILYTLNRPNRLLTIHVIGHRREVYE